MLDDAAELMAEDIALFGLDNHPVEEVHVASAHSGAGDSYENIMVFDELGLADLLCVTVLIGDLYKRDRYYGCTRTNANIILSHPH